MPLPHCLCIPPTKPSTTKETADLAGLDLVCIFRQVPVLLGWLHRHGEQTVDRVEPERRLKIEEVMRRPAEESVVDAGRVGGVINDPHLTRGGDLGQDGGGAGE
jgi:hypothetical protein